jgi:oxygen-independent coproporphyrinogen-3 oxidase
MNGFGIYIHIPYCLQRCSYCDFATYKFDEILPPDQYVAKLRQEIRMRSSFWPPRSVDTIYFGGGTPSLISPNLLKTILQELEDQGWDLRPVREMTIEINPATITHEKMEEYLKMGINRFSVGAQTFKDSTLKYLNREHDSQQTLETLKLLQSYQVSFFDGFAFCFASSKFAGFGKGLGPNFTNSTSTHQSLLFNSAPWTSFAGCAAL